MSTTVGNLIWVGPNEAYCKPGSTRGNQLKELVCHPLAQHLQSAPAIGLIDSWQRMNALKHNGFQRLPRCLLLHLQNDRGRLDPQKLVLYPQFMLFGKS